MSFVHIWWESDVALCGSTEIGHGEPCATRGEPWPRLRWESLVCPDCGVPLCRDCVRISAERHGYPVANVPLLCRPAPPIRLVVSV